MASDIRRWIVRTTAGEAVGFAVAASAGVFVATNDIPVQAAFVVMIAAGTIEGALLGAGQWAGLPGLRPRGGAWIAATAAGAALAWTLGMLPSTIGFDPASPFAPVVFVGGAAALLACIPTAQWLVIRRRTALRWIPINMVAWAVGLLWTLAPSPLVDERSPLPVVLALYVAAGALMAVTVAAVTASTAVRLFPRLR